MRQYTVGHTEIYACGVGGYDDVEAGIQEECQELNKQAELEKQKAYTKEYFENKRLDVQQSAVEAINPSVKKIITSGDGEGYSGLVGVKEVLDSIGN